MHTVQVLVEHPDSDKIPRLCADIRCLLAAHRMGHIPVYGRAAEGVAAQVRQARLTLYIRFDRMYRKGARSILVRTPIEVLADTTHTTTHVVVDVEVATEMAPKEEQAANVKLLCLLAPELAQQLPQVLAAIKAQLADLRRRPHRKWGGTTPYCPKIF